MKGLVSILLALCLCICVSLAFAKGDPGDGRQSGLDVFYPGMSRADAQKMGAMPAGDHQMKAKVPWGDSKWGALLLFKGQEISLVGLSAKVTSNAPLLVMLQDMQERFAVPMLIIREENGREKEQNLAKLVAEGKGKGARDAILNEELNMYASQKNGSMTVIFCPEAMLEALGGEMQGKGGIDEKSIMAKFGGSMLYSLTMDKKDNAMTVVVTTLSNVKIF